MKKWALRVFIGSISLSAMAGIYVILAGDMGATGEKVLATALSVSLLSILAMSCGAALEKGRLGVVPYGGSGMALLSFVVLMVDIWGWWEGGNLARWWASLALVSVAASLSSLYALAELRGRLQAVRWLGFASAVAVAGLFITMLWDIARGEAMERALGVCAILLATATVAIPVLHWVSRSVAAPAPAPSDVMVRYCVACGKPLTVPAEGAQASCTACGAGFSVRFNRS